MRKMKTPGAGFAEFSAKVLDGHSGPKRNGLLKIARESQAPEFSIAVDRSGNGVR